MAQTIQLKRGTGSAVPSSLTEGELALNVDSGKLYYGQTSTSASSDFRFNNITASGDISASGTVTGLTGSFNQLSVLSSGDSDTPPLEGHLFRVTDTTNNNPDVDHFFVENQALTYGMRWHYDGGDNDFKLYRHNNSAAGTPVIKFNRGDDNIVVYGSLTGVSTLGGSVDAVLNISADSDIIYTADSDGDEVGQHIFKDRTATLLTIDETGADFSSHITASGNISASGNIIANSASVATVSLPDNGNIHAANTVTTNISLINDDYWNFNCNGSYVMKVSNIGVNINPDGASQIDFKVEGNSDAHLLFVDAGADKVAIGTGTVGNSLLTIDGDVTATHLTASNNIISPKSKIGLRDLDLYSQDGATGSLTTAQGDMFYHSSDSATVPGKIYTFASNGNVTLADKDDGYKATGSMFVALGTLSSQGMLLRGMIKLHTGSAIFSDANPGQPLYLGDGGLTQVDPPGSGDFVRIVAHYMPNDVGTVYFNPDNTWVEVS